jgi:hypothetical protein
MENTSIFIVVDTNTGRFFGAFTQQKWALLSLDVSYSKCVGLIKVLHEDVWNTDVKCPNGDLLTIKRVQPKDFAEHL